MDKVFINLFVPALDRSFDLELPINLDMKYIVDKIQESLSELTDGSYKPREQVKFYDKSTGYLINLNNIVKYSGLKNGSSILML